MNETRALVSGAASRSGNKDAADAAREAEQCGRIHLKCDKATEDNAYLQRGLETRAQEEQAAGNEEAEGTPTGTRTLPKVLGREPGREE